MGGTEGKEAEFFQKFDVVVATTCNQAELVRINSICRAAKILFYAGDVFGFFGFSFMDLVSHNFVEEVTTQVQSGDGGGDEPKAKKQRVETETKSVKKEMGHSPRPAQRQEDLAKLKELRDATLTKLSVPTTKIPDEMLGFLFAELSPVAAIVGGVLGQEVIKAISSKDAPHNNFFFYNPMESCGVVETIGY